MVADNYVVAMAMVPFGLENSPLCIGEIGVQIIGPTDSCFGEDELKLRRRRVGDL